MHISAQHINYKTPAGATVLNNISLTISKGEKAAIVGNNGTGKSTLLKILAKQINDFNGEVTIDSDLYFVPQHYGHYNNQTVAEALGIDKMISALQAIENGATEQHYFDLLENNWNIIASCKESFARWGLSGTSLNQSMAELSGGMKTKLFLSGIGIFDPGIVILDEPTNHLDSESRKHFYKWMEQTTCTLLIVSHDRHLLRLCNHIWELKQDSIHSYGGNFDFYEQQKAIESSAVENKLTFHEKALKDAKLKQQQSLERKQHADAQARKNARNSSDPKILLNSLKNTAEVTSSKLKQVHAVKVAELRNNLKEVADLLEVHRIMKAYFEKGDYHNGKILIQANAINFAYSNRSQLWQQPLTFTIRSGDRIRISGINGSGKSTLFKLLQQGLVPGSGQLNISAFTALLLDQDYSIVDRSKTILEQALASNEANAELAIVHTIMANFIFLPDTWNKSCSVLSGGEMLRLSLCCMVLQNKTPDVIFLDEPANNLDLANIRMLSKIFHEYRGTLIVISHDEEFIQEAGVNAEIIL